MLQDGQGKKASGGKAAKSTIEEALNTVDTTQKPQPFELGVPCVNLKLTGSPRKNCSARPTTAHAAHSKNNTMKAFHPNRASQRTIQSKQAQNVNLSREEHVDENAYSALGSSNKKARERQGKPGADARSRNSRNQKKQLYVTQKHAAKYNNNLFFGSQQSPKLSTIPNQDVTKGSQKTSNSKLQIDNYQVKEERGRLPSAQKASPCSSRQNAAANVLTHRSTSNNSAGSSSCVQYQSYQGKNAQKIQ